MNEKPLSARLIKGALLRVGLGLPLIALVIIAPAGTWAYWQGWMWMATILGPMFFIVPYFMVKDPALLERRMRMREKEATQRKIIALSYLYFLVAFVLPGLDVRFGWSNVPPWVSILANVFVLAGYMTFVWVLTVNSYLSRTVQVDAGQKVVSTGPYGIVRHPMYAGVIVMYIASPLALGSYWAILPAALVIPLLMARIRNEEEVLLRDLPGYAEYRQKIKYRLLPGVW
jgi:protein-S-isoprenylcysteine O-methyltransferase Ste14